VRPQTRFVEVTSQRWIVVALSTAAFAWILWRTAWMCDDAYITLRTIDNVVNGYGLRWNVAERVQSYTHPAWLLLITPFYALTREPYFTTLAIQIVLSIATIFLLTRYVALTAARAATAAAVLISSKALTDFSTSGLENPLTHVALTGVFLLFRETWRGQPRLAWLAAFTSLAVLCRQDLIFLVGPALVAATMVAPGPRVRPLAVGLAPLAVWFLFSLVYYGALIPNTALAKLHTGVPAWDLVRQGANYWRATFQFDPVTVVAIASGLVLIVWQRGRAGRVFAAGAVLYSLYLLRVGGDFMSGRFLTPLLFWIVLAAAGIENIRARHVSAGWGLLAAAAIVIAGLFATDTPPLLSPASFGAGEQMVEHFGVTDERRFYYPSLGLQRHLGWEGGPAGNPWAETGRRLRPPVTSPSRLTPEVVVSAKNVGLFGYYAGPSVHIVDRHGLCDPLLARLPALTPWRIGHYERELPPGYLEGWRAGTNALADPALHTYYERIRRVTQGPVWSAGRWLDVIQINLARW
jgi:arabinofuranosyltransferase